MSIDVLTREPIGKQYEVETELPISYTSGNPTEAIMLKSAVRLVPHVQDIDLKIRYHNKEPYVVAVITVDAWADSSFLWQDIEKTFNSQIEEA